MGDARDRPTFEGATVDDLVAPRTRVLFIGINPGLWTAKVNAHFARPGNRFWPALHRAGVTPWLVDPSQGMRADDLAMLADIGVSITNLVATASARADQLTASEVRAGAATLARRVVEFAPSVVAVLGLTTYRRGFARPSARAGEQPDRLGGVPTWVLPNPSGLNAHETVESLAAASRQAWDAAQPGWQLGQK